MHAGNSFVATVAILTISDTRTFETDSSGAYIEESLAASPHRVLKRVIVPDDAVQIKQAMEALKQEDIHCIISTGGTGLAKRDVTFETLVSEIIQEIPGFGELFRQISFAEIGTRAMATRAFSGFLDNDILFFALPGSKNACETGMKHLILPEMGHLLAERHK
ncbi:MULTISPECIES: molybdenum cofactor biosynthesis protein B [Listeria]|uniref:MogA/MoaB family molybdenum cofactor biosynthesis protein n=1 Tax=Listeria TaxID=1637 RepID=UPI000B58786E|nr:MULTISPECIES: molybdenum cofactor biosynthesis protein B [Listeria]